MNILILSPYFHPHKGGSQQYMEELHVRLMAQDKSVNVDVLTYNTDGGAEQETYRGMTVYRVPCLQILPGQFAIPNYLKIWQLLKKLKKNKYDVVNANTRFFESAWWAPFAARFLKAKLVLTDHCATHPAHSSDIVRFVAYGVDRILVPFVLRFYEKVIVTNNATREFIRSLGYMMPTLLHGGVDTAYFAPTSPKRKIFRTITVTFVGRMIPSKGPQILYEIARKVVKKDKRVRFVFGGGGEMHHKLSAKKVKNISFTGELNKKRVASLLKKTDILVHPSLHHEGFPNVLLEAGAAHCAVVATDQGGTNEIILDGKTGYLVEPKQAAIEAALNTLLRNTDQIPSFQKALANHVKKHFEWKLIAKKYQKFLANLVGAS